jgi:hypothetical protein
LRKASKVGDEFQKFESFNNVRKSLKDFGRDSKKMIGEEFKRLGKSLKDLSERLGESIKDSGRV